MNVYNLIEKRIKIFDYLLNTYAISLSEKMTLETNEDFLYLSDLETYELYLINVAGAGKVLETWGDYKGKKCYEVLQKRSSPCPYCTNHLLSQDQYYIWKYHNDVIGGDYILKDKLIEWEGKVVRMEVVMDISNSDRIDQVLRRSLDGQNLLTSGMMLMNEEEDFKEAVKKLLIKVCRFFDADGGFIEYFEDEDIMIDWDGKTGEYNIRHYTKISEDMIEYWKSMMECGKQVIIKNPQHFLERDAKAAKVMERYDIQSFCITPLFGGNRLMGFIGIKNINTYWTELPILKMLGSHVTSRLIKEQLQRENERIQFYDATTGYLNFDGFKKKAELMLKENPHKKYALWYSDLKKFKYINDAWGYEVGDRVLRYWADMISDSLKEYETFGRISGDKFVILKCYEKSAELEGYFNGICKRMDVFAAQFRNIRAELACGAYLMERPEDRLSFNEMMDRANIAEKHVKEKPGSNMAVYDEEMRQIVVQEMEMEAALAEALQNEEFLLYFQPQMDLNKNQQCLCAEALVRWKKQDKILIYPSDFIPLFERDGMIPQLDHYVFEHACQYIKTWESRGGQPLRISVNVSRVTMLQADFAETYCRTKERYQIRDGSICLEFTESIVVENLRAFKDIIRELKKHGFWCAMDDFGSDQSSLNVLKDVPMDILKLDRQFFDHHEDRDRREAVVSCVLQLASALHMETVAEGVETVEMMEILRNMGCDYIQGYVYARPMSAEKYERFIAGEEV